ncbi:MAG: hypothetical protein JW801_05515 [Bacteroidales bacterium]|nr:hypothetical protein [Bacteroidales bacterium]
MSKGKYIFLGSIRKTYGVSGALVIRTPGTAFRFKKSWETVFIEIDGILVPFFIESWEQSDAASIIIKIDQFNDKETASGYVHMNIYCRQADLAGQTREIVVRQLQGFSIRDKKTGDIGIVKEYLEIKNNPLFLVSGKDKEYYIPANPDFITRIDAGKKIIFMVLPEGLADNQ